MSTILLGWELGSGLGHVRRAAPIVHRLSEDGHRVVVALRDLRHARAFRLHEILQAPYWVVDRFTDCTVCSYTDLLKINGFSSAQDLMSKLRGWEGILDLVKPDLVIADHSPTLCLATYGTIPTVVIGNGYTVPPDGEHFPQILPGKLSDEQEVLNIVKHVQCLRGMPVPETLPRLFAGEARFITVLSELDPYARTCAGPLERIEPSKVTGDLFFAYLNAEEVNVDMVFSDLTKGGLRGSAYIQKSTAAIRDRIRGLGIEVFDEPVAIDKVLNSSSVIVHHGGCGLAQQCLMAGRPQLMIPQTAEHFLYSRLVQDLKVGLYVTKELPREATTKYLHGLTASPKVKKASEDLANSLQGGESPLSKIIDACKSLV